MPCLSTRSAMLGKRILQWTVYLPIYRSKKFLPLLSRSSSDWQPCGRTPSGDATSLRVSGLSAEKEHRLRVVAVNAEGASDPLVCPDAFVPESPFGVPSAPGQPEMVDGDSDHFVVAWDPPRHDGGSEVKGYQLEARRWKDTGEE